MQHSVDLHGYHPHDADLYDAIEGALRKAYDAGAESLLVIHGHGHNRDRERRIFANSNTGWLGLTVRGILRHQRDLRRYMMAKIDVSHDGSTTVRIRPKAGSAQRQA